jgi:cell division cycle 14
MQEADRQNKKLYLYCGPHANQKANTAVLVSISALEELETLLSFSLHTIHTSFLQVGIFLVIFLNKSAEDAYKPLLVYKPYVPFRDASCGVSTFHLTVYDVIKGMQKARDVGFVDWNSGNSTFDVDEYEFYEQVCRSRL